MFRRNLYKKILWITLTILGVFAFSMSCGSMPGSGGDDRRSEARGNLVLINQSGEELAIFVDNAYSKTISPGAQMNIHVAHASPNGTQIEVSLYQRNRITDLSVFPDSDAYFQFPMAVYSLDSGRPDNTVTIRRRSDQEIQQFGNLGSSLVRFSYLDLPRVLSTVEIFIGSVTAGIDIAVLNNGGSITVPMPHDTHAIAMRYRVGPAGTPGSEGIFPTSSETWERSTRFIVFVGPTPSEILFTVPMVQEIFNIEYDRGPLANGILRVMNNSGQNLNVQTTIGINQPPTNIAGNISSVPVGERRDFSVTPGDHQLRATSIITNQPIANIEPVDVNIFPGMIYYWQIGVRNAEFTNMPNLRVPQAIRDFFQTWMISSEPSNANISLRIHSAVPAVSGGTFNLGVTNNSGQLILRDRDIENLFEGLTTTNARNVILTFVAEREGYYTSYQTISAYSLLAAGSEFRLDQFRLERLPRPEDITDIRLGEPLDIWN